MVLLMGGISEARIDDVFSNSLCDGANIYPS